MTGVIKSNRCGTCRRRKVKCDEVKPTCGPCQKGNRVCEDPISKVKFTKPKQPLLATTATVGERSRPRSTFHPCREIAVIRSTATDEGGSFQTLRMGRPRKIPDELDDDNLSDKVTPTRRPLLSPIESLQLVLLQTFQYQPGFRLSSTFLWMTEIPARLGYSAALDDAVACIMSCHALICRNLYPGKERKQAGLYAKALFSLQEALQDPVESLSDNTLAAVTILGQVEVLGGGDYDDWPKYINHAGGATRLIQIRGPSQFQTNFSRMLFYGTRGAAISVATLRNEDCFYSQPEWLDIPPPSIEVHEATWSANDLQREMVKLPSLLKKIRRFHASPAEIDPLEILRDAQRLRRSIQPTTDYINECLQAHEEIYELPSAYNDTLVPVVYNFSNHSLASAAVAYWSISLILDTITAQFLPPDTPASTFEALQSRCIRARQQVCMSWEHCEQFRPLCCKYMSGPLIMVYYGATDEEKIWIMHRLWTIGELMPRCREVWGPLGLEIASRHFVGDMQEYVTEEGNSGENPYKVAWEKNCSAKEQEVQAYWRKRMKALGKI